MSRSFPLSPEAEVSTIEFATAEAARSFLRQLRFPKDTYPLQGIRLWSPEKVIATATKYAGGFKASEIAAMVRKGVRFKGVRCERCGAPLTARESVMAGIGPECMAR